jgi:RNA polymerase sigma-70 factor (ECF subfamily)
MQPMPFEYDAYFLLRFKKGDEHAFEMVFKGNYNRIIGFCRQFVRDTDKSQGLAQEAFVKLWLNRSKIESVNGIQSFLYTAARSECLNYLRHEKVISNYENMQLQIKERLLDSEILESFNFDELEFAELEKLINQAISELPERCRQVFILSRLEGKKNIQIAGELDISVKSVEANLTRALKTLRVKLTGYLPAIMVQVVLQNL